MPYVQVTWVAGRTPEQKRKLAERITQALIEDSRAKRESIQVTFVDLPPTTTLKRASRWPTRSARHSIE
jgi:4-oxalocrotonate tautomerase